MLYFIVYNERETYNNQRRELEFFEASCEAFRVSFRNGSSFPYMTQLSSPENFSNF